MHTDSMRMTMDQILDEIREWADEDVAELVDRIYCVTYGEIDRAVEAASREEVNRRVADLESGLVQGIPLEGAQSKARAIVAAAHEN